MKKAVVLSILLVVSCFLPPYPAVAATKYHYQGLNPYAWFSLDLQFSTYPWSLGSVPRYLGSWKNSANGTTGTFDTAGYYYDETPLILFEWGGVCPGAYFAVAGANHDLSLIYIILFYGYDCVNHLNGGGYFIMEYTGKSP